MEKTIITAIVLLIVLLLFNYYKPHFEILLSAIDGNKYLLLYYNSYNPHSETIERKSLTLLKF